MSSVLMPAIASVLKDGMPVVARVPRSTLWSNLRFAGRQRAGLIGVQIAELGRGSAPI